MRRKTRDLFEILGERKSRGGGGKAQKRVEIATPWELGRGIADWFRRLLGRQSGARIRRRSPARPTVGGPALAAVVIVAVGLGFLLGRVTGGGAAELRAQVGERDTARAGEEPGWVNTAVDLPAEKETERLSQFGYPVLLYPASERQAAGRAARWLRAQGCSTARVRGPMRYPGDTRDFWVVVCYAEQGDADVGARLESLARSDAWPQLPAGAKRYRPRLIKLQN